MANEEKVPTKKPQIPHGRGVQMTAFITNYYPEQYDTQYHGIGQHGRAVSGKGFYCLPGYACANNDTTLLPPGTFIEYTDNSPSPVTYYLMVCDTGDPTCLGTKEQRKANTARAEEYPDFLTADVVIDVACAPVTGAQEPEYPKVLTGGGFIEVFLPSNKDPVVEAYRKYLIQILTNGTVEKGGSHAVGNSSVGSEATVPSLHRLMQTMNFIHGFVDGAQTGTFTMAELIEQQLSKVHCHLYLIPNLYKGKNLVAKPELLFQKAPTCNMILPTMKEGISFTYSMKERPTRMVISADPLSIVSNGKTIYNMYGISYIGQTQLYDAKSSTLGVPIYKLQFESPNSANYEKLSPVIKNITNFEVDNGIYCGKKAVGSELALYTCTYGTGSDGDVDSSQNAMTLNYDYRNPSSSTAGKMLQEVANYELAKAYYAKSGGSIQMYFDPYLVPGFPFVSIEKTNTSLCIHGYITNIAHELSNNSWRTLVTYSCGHLDNEHPPETYPIYEEEYTKNLAATYQALLGPSVLPVQDDKDKDHPGIITQMQTLSDRDPSVSECFTQVWRETQSLDEWMKDVADGAELNIVHEHLWAINNNSTIMNDTTEEGVKKRFFNKDLQERIQKYSQQVLAGRPFHISEVN